ncbi:hypothetical protein [Undibacter mobilis]|nr:hypothetical protein [Undibacter mobilis]
MGKALQGWMDAHGLPAIAAAVVTIIVGLALFLVLGGYWLAAP